MRIKINLTVLIIILVSFISKAQNKNVKEKICMDCTVQELIESEKLEINMQLIQAVQEYKQENYVSFSDIFYSLNGRQRVEFIREYLRSDLENETLTDIKNKITTDEERIELNKEDIDWFIQVKEEIKRKSQNNLISKNN